MKRSVSDDDVRDDDDRGKRHRGGGGDGGGFRTEIRMLVQSRVSQSHACLQCDNLITEVLKMKIPSF